MAIRTLVAKFVADTGGFMRGMNVVSRKVSGFSQQVKAINNVSQNLQLLTGGAALAGVVSAAARMEKFGNALSDMADDVRKAGGGWDQFSGRLVYALPVIGDVTKALDAMKQGIQDAYVAYKNDAGINALLTQIDSAREAQRRLNDTLRKQYARNTTVNDMVQDLTDKLVGLRHGEQAVFIKQLQRIGATEWQIDTILGLRRSIAEFLATQQKLTEDTLKSSESAREAAAAFKSWGDSIRSAIDAALPPLDKLNTKMLNLQKGLAFGLFGPTGGPSAMKTFGDYVRTLQAEVAAVMGRGNTSEPVSGSFSPAATADFREISLSRTAIGGLSAQNRNATQTVNDPQVVALLKQQLDMMRRNNGGATYN